MVMVMLGLLGRRACDVCRDGCECECVWGEGVIVNVCVSMCVGVSVSVYKCECVWCVCGG